MDRNAEKREIIQIWLEQNKSYREIANEINELYETTYYDSERVRDIIRRYRRTSEEKSVSSNANTRILHISDTHVPFQLPIDIYKDYIGKIDILILNGDISDCQGISKFKKKYRKPFVDEMVESRQFIIDLITYLKPKKTLLNAGNHEHRFINYFSDKIHDDLLQLMPDTSLDLICDLGFWRHNHQDKSRTYYEPISKILPNVEYTKEWFCQVGKTIFAHPKAFKQGILASTEKAHLYFIQQGYTFDTIVLAHTHKQGFARYGKQYLFESGCCCEDQEYATSGSLIRPADMGFMYLEQDSEGNLIYDNSKLICLD